MARFLTLLMAVSLFAGCADYSVAKGEYTDNARPEADTATLDSALELEPAWYAVRAELSIAEGLAVAERAVVTLEVVDADLERVDCTVEVPVTDLTATDVGLEGVWWLIPVDAPEDACAPLPEQVVLGVAAMHPDVRARLGAVSLDDVADSLFGAWILPDAEEEPSAFGYAGTEADRSGDDVATLPPPDGDYEISPLYLLPLPE